MAKAIKICKVCGKEYEYCRTFLPTAFRWQDVACCQEHAQEYLALVEASRAKPQAENTAEEPAKETATVKPTRKKKSGAVSDK